jgi:hypothetical protein
MLMVMLLMVMVVVVVGGYHPRTVIPSLERMITITNSIKE